MAVYVDESRNPYGRMVMCHMVADSLDELHQMADNLGLCREWFQNKPGHPHYDLSKTKRMQAIRYGAVEVTSKQLVEITRRNYHG